MKTITMNLEVKSGITYRQRLVVDDPETFLSNVMKNGTTLVVNQNLSVSIPAKAIAFVSSNYANGEYNE